MSEWSLHLDNHTASSMRPWCTSSMRLAEATKCSGQSPKSRLNIVALIFKLVLLIVHWSDCCSNEIRAWWTLILPWSELSRWQCDLDVFSIEGGTGANQTLTQQETDSRLRGLLKKEKVNYYTRLEKMRFQPRSKSKISIRLCRMISLPILRPFL
jgi:hypothetical protein